MSAEHQPPAPQYTAAEFSKLLHHYLQQFQRVHALNETFLQQKFTFINALERDHRVNGGAHVYMDTVGRLEEKLHALQASPYSHSGDISVISQFLDNVRQLLHLVQGLVQMHRELRPAFRFPAASSDRAVDTLKHYMHPGTSLVPLQSKFQVHLNDREAAQFGGLINLVPFVVQTANDVIQDLDTHLREQQRLEIDAIRQAQYQKPSTPQVEQVEQTTADQAAQARAEEIFSASRVRSEAGTQLSAADWRRQQLQEKHRNYVYSQGNFPPFATDSAASPFN